MDVVRPGTVPAVHMGSLIGVPGLKNNDSQRETANAIKFLSQARNAAMGSNSSSTLLAAEAPLWMKNFIGGASNATTTSAVSKKKLPFATEIIHHSNMLQRPLVNPVDASTELSRFQTRDLLQATRERVDHASAQARLNPRAAGIATNLTSWQARTRTALEEAKRSMAVESMKSDMYAYIPISSDSSSSSSSSSSLRPVTAPSYMSSSSSPSLGTLHSFHDHVNGAAYPQPTDRYRSARDRELADERDAAELASVLQSWKQSRTATNEAIERRIQARRRPKSANLATRVEYRSGVKDALIRPSTVASAPNSSGGLSGNTGGGLSNNNNGSNINNLPLKKDATGFVVVRESVTPTTVLSAITIPSATSGTTSASSLSSTSASTTANSSSSSGNTTNNGGGAAAASMVQVMLAGGKQVTLEFPSIPLVNIAVQKKGTASHLHSSHHHHHHHSSLSSSSSAHHHHHHHNNTTSDEKNMNGITSSYFRPLTSDGGEGLAIIEAALQEPYNSSTTSRPGSRSSSPFSSRPSSASFSNSINNNPSNTNSRPGSRAAGVGGGGDHSQNNTTTTTTGEIGGDVFEGPHSVRLAPRLAFPIVVTRPGPPPAGAPHQGSRHKDRPSVLNWWDTSGRSAVLEKMDNDAHAASEAKAAALAANPPPPSAAIAASLDPHYVPPAPIGPAGVPLIPEASIKPTVSVLSAVPELREKMEAEDLYDIRATVAAFDKYQIAHPSSSSSDSSFSTSRRRPGSAAAPGHHHYHATTTTSQIHILADEQKLSRALLSGPRATQAATQAQTERPVSASSGFFGLGENPVAREKRIAALKNQILNAAKGGKKGGGGGGKGKKK